MVAAGIAFLAMGAASGFLVLRLWDDRSAPPIVIDDPRPNAEIVVSVEGAVATPGVYHLPGDARVESALAAAGGAAPDADLSRINPAARLHDEERLIVPALVDGDRTSSEPVSSAAANGPAPAAAQVNINTATAEMLDTLPGIGPVLAVRIVTYRETHGPFRSVDELAAVDGISLAMVDEIRSLVTV
ncbi:MAG TPA: ComEA family DNA-binding protein [Thermomicrobiales bacterium]|jgi:competence protein ComEA